MSNDPDDKRPQSDVADQLAGTPVDDTTGESTNDTAGVTEPAPLVEPEPPVARETGSIADQTNSFGDESGSTTDAEPDHAPADNAALDSSTTDTTTDTTAAAEATPLPAGIDPEPAAERPSAPPVAAPAPAPVAPPAASTPQTVYVSTPSAPRKKGNRGVGTLLAVLGTIAFALLHSMITAIAYTSAGRSFDVAGFFASSGFLVPTFVFLVVFVIAVLLINRAGWWAWVLGSIVVAVVTYLASIGIIMLLENVVAMTPTEAQDTWQRLAVSAPMVIAIIVAREVAIWFGLAIAARGRRVKARNVEARAEYERELADTRARYAA